MNRKLKTLLLAAVVSAPLFAGILVAPSKTVSAAPDTARAGIVDIWDDIADFLPDWLPTVWAYKKVRCTTDLDCLIRNMTVSMANNAPLLLIGSSTTELTGDDLKAMREGRGTGLASTVGSAIDGGLSNPLGLNLASYFRNELSDNVLNDLFPTARAQTTGPLSGEDILMPVQEIWVAVRNASYGLFAVIMVAIGFMIILQKEISPRVVVTFTSALPKILISLVLITFSYPLIALAYDVTVPLGGSIITNSLPDTEILQEPSAEVQGGLVKGAFSEDASKMVGEASTGFLKPFVDRAKQAAGDEGLLSSNALQALGAFFIFLVLLVLVLVLVLIQIVYRLAKLLVYTIFSPFIILFSSLPGQEGGLSKFSKSLFATLLAFPAIAFMFRITRLILLESIQVDRSGFLGLGPGFGEALILNILALVFLVLTALSPSLIGNFIEGGGKKK